MIAATSIEGAAPLLVACPCHGARLPGGALVLRAFARRSRPLSVHREVEAHSTGLEWGYQGQGPLQLAIALLADALGEHAARQIGRRFYERVTAELPRDTWSLTREEVLMMARSLGWRGALAIAAARKGAV